MRKTEELVYNELKKRKVLTKKVLNNICKKYRKSKSEIFSFLSFSEELFKKTDLFKKRDEQ